MMRRLTKSGDGAMMRRLPKSPVGYFVYKPWRTKRSLLFVLVRHKGKPSRDSGKIGIMYRINGVVSCVSLSSGYVEKPKHLSMAQFVFMLCARDRMRSGK